MATFKHKNPKVSGTLHSNTHNLMLHCIEVRPKNSKDASAWAPHNNSIASYKTGLTYERDDLQYNVHGTFDAKGLAKTMVCIAADNPSHSYRIVRYPASQDDADNYLAQQNWKAREASRFADGTYEPLPWANEPWFKVPHDSSSLFAHVSKAKPGMVAFTALNEQGIADRHTVMNPGRFLQEFFSCDALYEQIPTGTNVHGHITYTDKLNLLAQDFAIKYGGNDVLSFATTANDIERVYQCGPESCMKKKLPDKFDSECHPARIYAAGDLALAYLTTNAEGGEDGESLNRHITARALVWPEHKRVGRPYGDVRALLSKLTDSGYDTSTCNHDWDTLEGARLLRIPASGGRFVMPYIDGQNSFGHHPDGVHLCIGGGYNAENQNGLSGEPQESQSLCERCGDETEDEIEIVTAIRRGGASRVDMWCAGCAGNHAFYCDLSDTHYSTACADPEELGGGRTVARHVAEREGYIWDDISGLFFHSDNLGGSYEGDETCLISDNTVSKLSLVWHAGTNSYYRPHMLPIETDAPKGTNDALGFVSEVAS